MAAFASKHDELRAVGAKVLAASVDPLDKAKKPSEFIVGPGNTVIDSSYSSGPIGRIDPADVVKRINFVEAQAKK